MMLGQGFSFDTLKHSINRRGLDYHYFLTPTKPHAQQLPFNNLADKLGNIQDALNRSPPVLPPEMHIRIVAALNTLTADAITLGKEIELNPFRTQRGATTAKSETTLKALRAEKFQVWRQAFQEIERDIKTYWDKEAEKKKMILRQTGSKL